MARDFQVQQNARSYCKILSRRSPDLESFSIVTSPANQRIEAFWVILLRDKIGWWKRFFQDIVDLNLFSNDDPVLLEAIRFCFMRLLRKELKKIASD